MSLLKNKKRPESNESKTDCLLPSNRLIQIKNRKYGEDKKRNYFLNRLQFRRRKIAVAEAIGGDLETIFEEGNRPAGEHYDVESRVFEF